MNECIVGKEGAGDDALYLLEFTCDATRAGATRRVNVKDRKRYIIVFLARSISP